MQEDVNQQNTGIQMLVDMYKAIFRVPENLDHYSHEDFKTAEKKYLKFSLTGSVD